MPDVKDRIRTSVGTLRVEPPDVVAIRRRAVRNRWLQRTTAGLLSVGLLIGGAGLVGGLLPTSGPEIRPLEDGAVEGWTRVAFGEVDPRNLEVGIVDPEDVEVVGTIPVDGLPDRIAGEPVVRAAVGPDGTVAVLSGHRVHVLHPDGRREDATVSACGGFDRFDLAGLDAQRRLHLATTDRSVEDERGTPVCTTVVSLDDPSAPAEERRFAVERGIHDALLVDGRWWLAAGDELDPNWVLAAEDGRPTAVDLRAREHAVPDGIGVEVAGIDQDPNALWQRTGWTMQVSRDGAAVGRIELASRHTWLGAPDGSSVRVGQAGAGRRLAMVEWDEGDGYLVLLGAAEGVALARVGEPAAALHRAGRGFTAWTVGGDDHVYWLQPAGDAIAVVRYRHRLP